MNNPEYLRHEFMEQLINREKWVDILKHFIDVLQIDIFLVSLDGEVIIPPCKDKYGGELWTANSDFTSTGKEKNMNFLTKFEKHGMYLEYNHHSDLQSFAIPLQLEEGKTLAYMIVGPVALNKRLDSQDLKKIKSITEKLSVNAERVVSILHEIRVVSFLTMKSILDLLFEVSKYVLQLSSQGQKFQKLTTNKESIAQQVSDAAQDIYSSICLDELLVTLLDVALSMTKTECGSIMVFDQNNQVLTIKVSRGLNTEIASSTQIKIGQGVAGYSAQKKLPLIIRGTHGDNRIKSYLKRPEIQHALVVPILTENNVFGVLNLHTKRKRSNINDESLGLIQNLSKLTSAAISSIQQKQNSDFN